MVIPVGIDIGNDKCVVAFSNEKGVVDVVYDESSSRETPLLIHFDKKQRLFGSAGVPYSSSNPKASISQLKRLIGCRFDEPSFQKERALLPYDTSQGPNGEVLVNVTYCGEDRTFTAVQLMGMFLSHLKKKAEGRLGSEISQCVIGIPSYLTDKQRRDYLLAAEIAGLKPLRLFHDGTATALDYCYFRNLPYGEATHVVFVDIGHSDTQVTVVRFYCETINVLAHYFDRDLGGRDFTDVIFRFFVEEIEREHIIDVYQNAKQSHRLRRECEKAKKILSLKTMAPINIDCLTNDIDVEDKITREEFEERSSDLLGRVVIACDRALGDAGLVTDDIHSVELCGSGSRIPKISQRLKDFLGKSIISRTLNSSECVANGCALQCGMLCPDFDLKRNFGVQDIFPFYLGFRANEDSSFAPSNIIAKGQFLGQTRAQILSPSKVVTISCAIENELPSDSWVNVSSHKMDIVLESEKCDMEFRFQFDLHGILRVQSVSLISDDHPQPNTSEDMDFMEIDGEDESRSTPQSREGITEQSKASHPAALPTQAPAPQTQRIPSGCPNANPMGLFLQGLPTVGGNGPGNKLDFPRDSPQFRALQYAVQANPHNLQKIVQKWAKKNPQLMTLIEGRQADLVQLINESPEGGGEGNPSNQPTSVHQLTQVTPEERKAMEAVWW